MYPSESTKQSPESTWEQRVSKILDFSNPEQKKLHDEKIEAMKGKPYLVGSVEQGFQLVGSWHTNKPESEMVKEIEILREQYLKEVDSIEAMYLIEGMYDSDLLTPGGLEETLKGLPDRDAAVRKYGEKGLMLWSARKDGVEIQSPEPSQNELVAKMEQRGFIKDQISLYLFIRQLTTEMSRVPEGETPQEASIYFARTFLTYDRLSGAKWISDATYDAVGVAMEKYEMTRDTSEFQTLIPKILTEYTDHANRVCATLPGMEGKKLVPSVQALIQRNQNLPETEHVSIEDVNRFHDPSGDASVVNQVSRAWNRERDIFIKEKSHSWFTVLHMWWRWNRRWNNYCRSRAFSSILSKMS